MEVKVLWDGQMGFFGKSGTNHSVVMDVSKEIGGGGSAPSPMEMVLFGLAGCAGVDIALILNKKKVQLDDFEVFVKAERAEDHPRVFTKVDLTFVFQGEDLRMKPLEDAVRLSIDKYCSVAGMISQTATIDWEIKIRE